MSTFIFQTFSGYNSSKSAIRMCSNFWCKAPTDALQPTPSIFHESKPCHDSPRFIMVHRVQDPVDLDASPGAIHPIGVAEGLWRQFGCPLLWLLGPDFGGIWICRRCIRHGRELTDHWHTESNSLNEVKQWSRNQWRPCDIEIVWIYF